MPLARFGDAPTNQLNNNVHRFAIGDVARKEGAHTIAIGNFALAIAMNLDGTLYVQSIAEYGLLRHRVDTQLLVLCHNLIHLLFLHTAIDAKAAEGHCHALG